MDKVSATSAGAGTAFATTHWSAVLQARDGDQDQMSAALAKMCESYWPPLFLFIVRRGHSRHDAEDLTQQFFEFLLQRDFLKSVDRSKGRFRSFLLASLKNFLTNRWHHENRQKRGGGRQFLSLDEATIEQEMLSAPGKGTEDEVFDRDWAVHLLARLISELQNEHEQRGKSKQFEQLRPFLSEDVAPSDYERIGQALTMNPGAVKVAVHRLRARYRELLMTAVAETVALPGDVRDEARYLLTVLRKTS